MSFSDLSVETQFDDLLIKVAAVTVIFKKQCLLKGITLGCVLKVLSFHGHMLIINSPCPEFSQNKCSEARKKLCLGS